MPTMWKYILAVATALVVRAGKIALGVSGSVTAPTAIRIGRRSRPSFRRPTPESVQPSIPDAWSSIALLAERLKADVVRMRPLQREIAAISMKYVDGAGSHSATDARRHAVALDRCLDRLDPLVSSFEQKTARAARSLASFDEGLSRDAGDLAYLLLIRRGLGDVVATMRAVRMVVASFQLLMTKVHGPSEELNASTRRAAALATRTIAAHDSISEACERLVGRVEGLLGR
jgi:hypothetical protein